MNLDAGQCNIYRRTSTTPPGGKPTWTESVIHQSYYGELNFETSPARPTEKRKETRTATRIRVHQNRSILEDDVAELIPFDGNPAKTARYRIARAWSGIDDESGERITDLTLEVEEK